MRAVGAGTLVVNASQAARYRGRVGAYELQVTGGGIHQQYNSSMDLFQVSGLPPASDLCARLRLHLRRRPEDREGVRTPWSACTNITTPPAHVPLQPVAPWIIGSASEAVLVQWAPGLGANPAPDKWALRWGLLVDGWDEQCQWTGPTCAEGCEELGEGNWTLEASSWEGMFADCRGANEYGCCGLQCWCFSLKCCLRKPALVVEDWATQELPADALNATLSGPALADGALFVVQLRAHSTAGWSPWSEQRRLHADSPGATAPEAPRWVSLDPGPLAVNVRWDPPADPGAMVIGHDLAVAAADSVADLDSSALDAMLADNATQHGLTILRFIADRRNASVVGLQPQTKYELWVRAFNSMGPSPWVRASVTTGLAQPPAAPRGVRVVVSLSDAITVTWAAPESVGPLMGPVPDTFEVLAVRQGATLSEVEALGTKSCEAHAPDVSCTLEDLQPESQYLVRVRARSAVGAGDYSTAIVASTAAATGCRTRDDQSLILAQRDHLHRVLDDCGKGCWGAGPCTSRCVERTGLSAECARCMGDVTTCTKAHCMRRCALDPDGVPCRSCSAEECGPAYYACVGLPSAMVP